MATHEGRDRYDRLNMLVKQYAGQYVSREAGNTALITITRSTISPDGKKCMVYFTALPVDKENAALGFLKRHRGDMRDYIESIVRTQNVPFIDVAVDECEKNYQRIDGLLKQ